MAVIPFVSPKGGVGKTTSAVVLATVLSKKARVTIIDADPNQPIAAWAELPGKPDNLTVISGVTQDSIIDVIREASERDPFVIVDLEGTASTIVTYAIGEADLIIIPSGPSQLEAMEAAKPLRMIRNAEKQLRRPLPYRILFTRTSAAIRTRGLADIQKQMREDGIHTFETHLHDREAFRAIFSYGGTLDDLDAAAVSNPAKARANALAYAQEVARVLQEEIAQ